LGLQQRQGVDKDQHTKKPKLIISNAKCNISVKSRAIKKKRPENQKPSGVKCLKISKIK